MASTSHLSTERICFTPRGARDRNPTDAAGYLTAQVLVQRASDARHVEQTLPRAGGTGILQQGREAQTSPLGLLGHRTPVAALPPSASTAPRAVHLSSTKEQTQKKKKTSGTATKKRVSEAAPWSPLFPEHIKKKLKAAASCSFTKVTQIFYLETAKPILISSISINNPTGCCNLAYKQREV